MTIETLRESFPNQDDLIDELVGAGKFLKTLRDFVRGKVSSRDLEDSDDGISLKPDAIDIFKIKTPEKLNKSNL